MLDFAALDAQCREPSISRVMSAGISRQDAEDLVQDAFLRAWTYRHSFNGKAKSATWFYTIVSNVMADHFRRGNRRRLRCVSLDETGDIAGSESDPAGQICTREGVIYVIGRLSPALFRVLGAVLECDTQQEAAERLGLSLSYIKSAMHRIRAAVNGFMGE